MSLHVQSLLRGPVTSFAQTLVPENSSLWRKAGGNLLLSSVIFGGPLLVKKAWNAYPIASLHNEKLWKTTLKIAAIALSIGVAFSANALTSLNTQPNSLLPLTASAISMIGIYLLNKYSTYNGKEIYEMLAYINQLPKDKDFPAFPHQVVIDIPRINYLMLKSNTSLQACGDTFFVPQNVSLEEKFKVFYSGLLKYYGENAAHYLSFLLTQAYIAPLNEKINAQASKSAGYDQIGRGGAQTVSINLENNKIHIIHKLRFDLLYKENIETTVGYLAAKIEYLLPIDEFLNDCKKYITPGAPLPKKPFPNCFKREVISKICQTEPEADAILASY